MDGLLRDDVRGANMAAAMPWQDQQPGGPHRDLVQALHELYRAAGRPSMRSVSTEIRKRDDLPDTVSHETVSAMLKGQVVPRSWVKVASLVLHLASASVPRRD